MDGIRELILTAVLMGTGLSLAEAVCPSERYEKQLRTLFAMLFIAAAAAPFLNGSINFNLDGGEEYTEEVIQSSAIYSQSVMKGQIMRSLRDELASLLKKNNITAEEISVSVNITEDNCINISEVSISISDSSKEAEAYSLIAGVLDENTYVRINGYGKTEEASQPRIAEEYTS